MKNNLKRTVSVALSFVMLLSMFPIFSLRANAATTLTSTTIANYFNNQVGRSYPSGYCLAFVADGFKALGATRSAACCAYKYGSSFIDSTSRDNIPIGADVFFAGSSVTCSTCGNKCGHIGVYVGDGYIVHAYSAKIQKMKISTVISQGYPYRGWGIHGNVIIQSPISITISNPNKDTQHVIFSWNAIDNAASYSLSIDGDQDGGHNGIKDRFIRGIKTTTYSVLLPYGNYTVWIDAVNSSGVSFANNWSTRPQFSVGYGDYLPVKTITYNGHVYSLYDELLEWQEAKTACENFGGHLATITSAGEQQAITNLLPAGKKVLYFIGGTDNGSEGNYKWITGESFSYTNWKTGEPNNTGNLENYLMIYNNSSEHYGKWNDIANHNTYISNNAVGFICENDLNIKPVATTNYNGSKYLLFDNSITWKDAKEACKLFGGFLATITSNEEQQAINGMLSSGLKQFYYIGGTDERNEGVFEWSTGEQYSFTNWYTNAPTNSRNLEDYMLIHNESTRLGKWNDATNDNCIYGNKVFGFVCEILNPPSFSATPTQPTNGSVTVKISYPQTATIKEYKIGSGAWTSYTTGFILTSNDTVYARCAVGTDYFSETSSVTITNIDKTAPVITVNPYATAPTNQNVVVTVRTNEGTLNATSHTFTTNGSFDFVATDAAGNVTTKTVTLTNIDKIAPVISVNPYTTAPTNQNIVVTVSTNEGILNATSHTFTVNGSFDFIATDSVGNITTKTVTVINIDKTPPAAPTFTLNPSIPTAGSIWVTINYPADAKNKEYKIGLSGWGQYTGTFEMDANNTVFARCDDNAGNISSIGMVDVANIVTPPASPTLLKAVSASYNSITLTWAAVSGATGYGIYRSTSQAGPYTKITAITGTSYTNGSLTTGKTYYYKVYAYKTISGTNISSLASAIVSAKPIPATPTNFKAVRASSTSIKLTWSPVAGANGYVIYKYNPTTKTSTRLKVLTATSYINTGLSKGVTYYYKVRAYRNMNGSPIYGNPSGAVGAKTY